MNLSLRKPGSRCKFGQAEVIYVNMTISNTPFSFFIPEQAERAACFRIHEKGKAFKFSIDWRREKIGGMTGRVEHIDLRVILGVSYGDSSSDHPFP